MPEYRYVVPVIPKSLNQYAGKNNAWAYRTDKAEWKQLVSVYCRPKPRRPIQKATVTLLYHFADCKRRDPDNYSGKMVLDGLTESKILMDDSFEHISLLIRQGAPDKKNPRLEIIIEPI